MWGGVVGGGGNACGMGVVTAKPAAASQLVLFVCQETR